MISPGWIVAILFWVLVTVAVIVAYLKVRSSSTDDEADVATDSSEDLSADQVRADQVSADQVRADQVSADVPVAEAVEGDDMAAAGTDANNSGSSTRELATGLDETVTTEEQVAAEIVEDEKEKIAVPTGSAASPPDSDHTTADHQTTDLANSSSNTGSDPDQKIDPVEANGDAPKSASSGDSAPRGNAGQANDDDHPNVEETACETVAKSPNGSGSRKKKKRGKARRKRAAEAAAAAAATGDSQSSEQPNPVSDEVDDTKDGLGEPSGEHESSSQGTDAISRVESQDKGEHKERIESNAEDDATDRSANDLEADSAKDTAATEDDTTERDESKVTIRSLLSDVDPPYGLRSVSDDATDADRHIVFVSSHSDAAEVGTAFADELERVGFSIEPAGNDEAIATRNGTTLTMRITPDAGNSGSYPELGATDVAIETWIL